MARPGFVLEVDERTPPLLVHQGEGFRLQKFPLGIAGDLPAGLAAAGSEGSATHIRHALDHPHDCEPLRELLKPGMKLTIAIDDISIPLPPMQSPDIRQLVLEEVIELAARKGVEDVKLYMANSLHRRMTADEIKHAVGERVFRSFYPKDLKNHDAEDRGQPRLRRQDRPGRGGRDQQAGDGVRPADLREHQPRRDGRRPQVGAGRARELPEREAPPQRPHDAALEVVHGPAARAGARSTTPASGWATC